MKRILFIANPCQNLYKDIETEMLEQGYDVVTLIDKQFKYDPHFRNRGVLGYISRPLKALLWKKQVYNYWDSIFREQCYKEKHFDILFVISGVSIDESIIKLIEQHNPGIKKVFYTWDSCNHYNFERFLTIMDNCYTFDIEDTEKNIQWSLLPIFYSEHKDLKPVKYDFFMIGSNHDGRYTFVKKLLPQLKNKGYSFFIKIVSGERRLSRKDKLKVLLSKKKWGWLLDEVKFSNGEENSECLERKGFSMEEYRNLLSQSKCVLDDQRDCQTGLSARFIWSLALGKYIYTTNSRALSYGFVNPQQVVIINKETPVISPIPSEPLEDTDISFFRIDNWVKTVLNK